MFSSRRTVHTFLVKNQHAHGVIELVDTPRDIDQDAARRILVQSFVGEYSKYLQPHDIDARLDDWHEGGNSVTKYYEDYFDEELKEFEQGKLHFWVNATINGKLVGWTTFKSDASAPNALYMNLLIVDPAHQGKGVGQYLVNSLINLGVIPNTSAIHILLRTKNQGGRTFYTKLGFNSDPDYKRSDNFVDMNLLEPLTWKNPAFTLDQRPALRQSK